MTPSRKRFYIILIIICLLISGGILVWNKVSVPWTDDSNNGSSEIVVAQPASGDAASGYMAPDVFPITDAFNTEVLNSESYKSLTPYERLDVTGQLGRSEPFKPY